MRKTVSALAECVSETADAMASTSIAAVVRLFTSLSLRIVMSPFRRRGLNLMQRLCQGTSVPCMPWPDHRMSPVPLARTGWSWPESEKANIPRRSLFGRWCRAIRRRSNISYLVYKRGKFQANLHAFEAIAPLLTSGGVNCDRQSIRTTRRVEHRGTHYFVCKR